MAIVRRESPRSGTWWVGIAVGVLSALVLYVGRDYRPKAVQFPNAIAITTLILAVAHTIIGVLRGLVVDTEGGFEQGEVANLGRRRAVYALWGLGAVLGIWIVGVHTALPVFLFLVIGFEARNWIMATCLAIAIWAFTYVLLSQVLHILLPASLLTRWLIANGYY